MLPADAEGAVSPFGVHHMAGNVRQWCAEEGLEGRRVEKGGGWADPPDLCHCMARRSTCPTAKSQDLGFRCVDRDFSRNIGPPCAG